MTLSRNLSLTFIVITALFVSSCLDNGTDAETERSNILEEIEQAEGFDTYLTLVSETGLDSLIANTGPYTVFVPTDQAFAELPQPILDVYSEEEVAEILTYHMINGIINLNNFRSTETIESRQGEDIYFHLTIDSVYVNDYPLIGSTGAANGVVYSTSGVSFPNSFLNTGGLISKRHELNILESALAVSELTEDLEDDANEFTVFAPADAILDTIDLAEDRQELRNALEYHVVPQKLLLEDLNSSQTLEALNGDELTIEPAENTISINGDVFVVIANIEGKNGVVHIINGFLE